MMKNLAIWMLIVVMTGWVAGCSQSGEDKKQNSDNTSQNQNDGELTEFEKEHGIGPVKEELDLKSIQTSLAAEGEELFTTNCSSCHKLDEEYVGPAQRNVIEQRSPEYIMNMILNPDEMVKKHPEAKKMLAEYMTPMPYQGVSREEARAILEYFRYVNKHESKTSVPE